MKNQKSFWLPLSESSQRLSENLLEHSAVHSDGIPRSASATVNYIQISDFAAASAPHDCGGGAVPSSVSVPSPSSPPLVPPRWHNTGDDAGVPPHQTQMKEGEKERGRGTDAERRITMRAEI